jgi:hypothetical protein
VALGLSDIWIDPFVWSEHRAASFKGWINRSAFQLYAGRSRRSLSHAWVSKQIRGIPDCSHTLSLWDGYRSVESNGTFAVAAHSEGSSRIFALTGPGWEKPPDH